MKYEIDNFIGVFHDVVDEKYCDEVIEFFEKVDEMGGVYCRQDQEKIPTIAKDNHIFHTDDKSPPVVFHAMFRLMIPFVKACDEAYKIYRKKYGILDDFATHRVSPTIQMQRVRPTQGYHVWHCENSGLAFSGRILVPILYLNDVEEGGETEFLHQSIRISPKKGTLLLFPAGFTHTHRGNPPLKTDKYFLTSWIQFVE
jgi:2OG-Fe(II) oxygenase superfamily